MTTGSKLELVPCLEEDRIDRKCLGREIDNERVEHAVGMPFIGRPVYEKPTKE